MDSKILRICLKLDVGNERVMAVEIEFNRFNKLSIIKAYLPTNKYLDVIRDIIQRFFSFTHSTALWLPEWFTLSDA